MKELLLIIANVTPIEVAAEKIKEAAIQFAILGTAEAKRELSFYCTLWLSKECVEENGLEEMLREVQGLEKTRNFFNLNKQ